MEIGELTVNQVKEIAAIANGLSGQPNSGLNKQIGKEVIIRTYSAGNWFGELEAKSGTEIYLKNARRMWQWKCAKSISLSGVAKYGIDHDGSHIAPAVERVWLDAIEIIEPTTEAASTIRTSPDAEAR